jgi:hypothetical protein
MFTDGADISPGVRGTVDVGVLLIAIVIIRLILIRPFVSEFPPCYGPEEKPVYSGIRVAIMVFLLRRSRPPGRWLRGAGCGRAGHHCGCEQVLAAGDAGPRRAEAGTCRDYRRYPHLAGPGRA